MPGAFNDELEAISGDNSREPMLALSTDLRDSAPMHHSY